MVPPQEVITNDTVKVKVNAAIFFQVLDARAAITRVFDYQIATSQITQTTARAVLGQSSLDELLAERDRINQKRQKIIDQQTEPWGVKVSTVELKDVELPAAMQRVLARQAEAEREKRAKIIAAEGEYAAAHTLADAAEIISIQSAALTLPYMQTLLDMGTDKNATVIRPLVYRPSATASPRGKTRSNRATSGSTANPTTTPIANTSTAWGTCTAPDLRQARHHLSAADRQTPRPTPDPTGSGEPTGARALPLPSSAGEVGGLGRAALDLDPDRRAGRPPPLLL